MNRTNTSLIVGAAIVGAAVYLAYFGPDDGSYGERILGVIFGLVVAWYANVAPKTLKPFARMACDPAREQRARRTTGIALTLGGLGYALVWILAPSGTATVASVAVLGGALLVSVGSWLLARSSSA